MLLLVLFAVIAPETAADVFDGTHGWILSNVSWFYILTVAIVWVATLSVARSLDKGIKILSQLNLGLAAMLMLFVLVAGPIVFILQTFVHNTGGYLSEIVSKTFNLYAYEFIDWIGGWKLFYWGWWLAWSPFVGMFIARISRGRTIREFVCGVLFMPAGFTLFWMDGVWRFGPAHDFDRRDA